ncbi:MAG: hypothetical protein LC745_09250, partial [Planctomycetia bacterium]|nr:hypothetical protein [Planctomycetia bacterium]
MGSPAKPRPGSEYRVSASALRVDAACDRFEAALHARRGPRIEDYLAEADAPWRRALLRELLLLEIELRRSAGGAPVPGPYRARFPGDADLVDAAFADADRPPAVGVPVETVPRPRRTDPCGPPPRSSEGRGAPASKTRRKLPRPKLASPTFGRYVVLAKLSEGKEAIVYRVFDPELSKELVLEWARSPHPPILSPTYHPAEVGRLLAGLDHPNLIRVVDVGAHERRPFLVTEPVPGLNLDRHAAQRRPAARCAANLVAELAGA